MSKQLYFFATGGDEEVIYESLLIALGHFYIIPARGDRGSMIPKLISTAEAMYDSYSLCEMHVIIKAQYIDSLYLINPSDNLYVVDIRSFPCLEYSRSVEIDENTLKRGRFAYFYEPKHSFAIDVEGLFRKIKKESEKLSDKIPHRIFREASQRYELLVNIGKPIKNPKYK